MIYETLQSFLPTLPDTTEIIVDETVTVVYTEFFYMQMIEYFFLCFFVIVLFCGVFDILKGVSKAIIKTR